MGFVHPGVQTPQKHQVGTQVILVNNMIVCDPALSNLTRGSILMDHVKGLPGFGDNMVAESPPTLYTRVYKNMVSDTALAPRRLYG